MTSGLLESPPHSLFAETRRVGAAGGRDRTLEERLERALRAVQADGHSACPVCGSSMRLDGGVGRCAGCGSMLS